MTDRECVEFLQWCLPELRLRWEGFRRVRRQVCKRLSRRLRELALPGLDAYRSHLRANEGEWRELDAMCRISISRFYRDRAVFDALRHDILPTLIRRVSERGETTVRCWSAGCGSGEEAYSLSILWQSMDLPGLAELSLHVTATGTDRHLLERANNAVYTKSSLKDLPEQLTRAAFVKKGGEFALSESYRRGVEFVEQDIRSAVPDGRFHLILCRNLAFTYFEESLQREVLARLIGGLERGGFLVIGAHESLPEGSWALTGRGNCIFEKALTR